MDLDTRREFQSITQEEWEELGYLDQDNITPTRGTITVRSLPIFDQRTSWTIPAGMTDDQFQQFTNTLSLVFQLATKIATSPASLEYFYYVLYSVRGELVVPSSDRDSSTKRFAKTYSIGPGETARRVGAALERLASSLKWAFTHPETWPMEGSKAVTVWDTQDLSRPTMIVEDAACRGAPSRIHLSTTFLTTLESLYSQAGNNRNQILNVQFQMAKTILHELTHALDYAINNYAFTMATMLKNGHTVQTLPSTLKIVAREPYFEGEEIAELGCSWENYVFGGYVDWKIGETSMPSFVREWPSFLSGYKFTRGAPDSSPVRRQWVVPMTWLRRLHRQEFWDAVDPGDVRALHIPRSAYQELLNPNGSTANS
jgi:hypothetical protein